MNKNNLPPIIKEANGDFGFSDSVEGIIYGIGKKEGVIGILFNTPENLIFSLLTQPEFLLYIDKKEKKCGFGLGKRGSSYSPPPEKIKIVLDAIFDSYYSQIITKRRLENESK